MSKPGRKYNKQVDKDLKKVSIVKGQPPGTRCGDCSRWGKEHCRAIVGNCREGGGVTRFDWGCENHNNTKLFGK